MGCTEVALASYEKAVMLAPGNIEYSNELNKYREENCENEEKDSETEISVDKPVLNIITPVVAEEAKDRAAMKFLDWYINEQVEEEASVGGVLATLKLIGDDKKALLLLDKDLATRTFTAPVIG